jgi:LacI family transcriptional regulator
MGGVDAEIRTGLTKYRGHSRKWLLHDLGRYSEHLHRVEAGALQCDVLVGYVNSATHAERLKRLGKPVLDLYQEFDDKAWRTHGIDYHLTGRMAAEHFIGLKHQHFGYVSLQPTRADRSVWAGFQEGLAGHAQHLFWIQREAEQMIQVLPEARTLGYPSHGERLGGLPKPCALLVHSDGTAELVATLAFFLGISVPEELSILGIGNMEPVCHACQPPLSSIQLPGEKLGYLVGEHLEAFMAGQAVEAFAEVPPLRVIQRQSTDIDAVSDPVVAKALALMRRHATSRMTIGEIAAKLPISKRSFNDRFTRIVGRTPREELERIRLGIARERLLSTSYTVLHIALESGFADVESMVRSFKNYLGVTPSEFRRQNRL